MLLPLSSLEEKGGKEVVNRVVWAPRAQLRLPSTWFSSSTPSPTQPRSPAGLSLYAVHIPAAGTTNMAHGWGLHNPQT